MRKAPQIPLFFACWLLALPCWGADYTVWWEDDPGLILYAVRDDAGLEDYETNAVQLVESSSPDTGKYSATLSDSGSVRHIVFLEASAPATQPASWADGRRGEILLVTNADIKRISGDATAADNAETAFDGGSYNVGGGAIVDDVPSNAEFSSALSSLESNLDATLTSIAGEVSDILVDTSAIPAFPTNFSTLGINVSGHVSRVTLADTITTYTGNTPQTGDSFARLGAPAGASVSADIADIPTNSELATSQAAADDATLAAIATAQTSIDDLPTNAELATSQAAADDATLAAIATAQAAIDTIDGIVDAILVDTGTTLDDLIDTEIAAIYDRLGAPAGDSIADDIADLELATVQPISADRINVARTWIANSSYRADNIVEVAAGFVGTLSLKPSLNPNTAIVSVSGVSITGAATVTATDLASTADRLYANFTVPALNTTGTYTVIVTVTTTDGQTIKTTATLKVY